MTIEEIAETYGLTTADRLPPASPGRVARAGAVSAPEAQENDHPSRWGRDKARAFKELQPAAVYVAGNEGPEPRYFGDNMGAWPILLGVTTCWQDTITPTMDRLSPLRPRGVLFRVWTPSREHARRLLASIEGLVRERVEQLRGAWLDFGPNTDASLFEAECLSLATRIGIQAWDDDGLSEYLDRLVASEMGAKVTPLRVRR